MNFRKYYSVYFKFYRNKKIKKYFLFATLVFIFFSISGFLYARNNHDLAQVFFRALSDKYLFAADYNFWQLLWFIFQNNILIALGAYLSGIIFGLPTFFILVVNSFVIGFVIEVASEKLDWPTIFLSMLPHGIFEIPAILFSLTIGFFIGDALFGFLFRGSKFKESFLFSVKLFVYLVVPLLFIAAIIESAFIVLFS